TPSTRTCGKASAAGFAPRVASRNSSSGTPHAAAPTTAPWCTNPPLKPSKPSQPTRDSPAKAIVEPGKGGRYKQVVPEGGVEPPMLRIPRPAEKRVDSFISPLTKSEEGRNTPMSVGN